MHFLENQDWYIRTRLKDKEEAKFHLIFRNRITPYLGRSQTQTSTAREKFMAAITVTLRQAVRLERKEVQTLQNMKSGFSRLRPRDLQIPPLQLPLPEWHPL